MEILLQLGGKDPYLPGIRVRPETNEGSDTSGLHTSRVQTHPRHGHGHLLSSSIVCCCGAALAVTLTL